jgi:F-type H+-transporting ATPase subunit b
MIGKTLILATHSAGFGINTNIFEANLINLLILVGVLFFFGKKLITNILEERKARIEEEITEAESRQKNAASALVTQQQKLDQAHAIAEQIRKEATARAEVLKQELLVKGEEELARMKEAAGKDLDSEQEKVITQLRLMVVALALEKSSAQLGNILDEKAQQKLIDRSIANLGGVL